MITLANLQSHAGTHTSIGFDTGTLEPLAREGKIDAYIVATEDGFSPLGIDRSFMASELGISAGEIADLANWNRFKNARVTLVAIPARREHARLRGVILAPSETSVCYKQFATPIYGLPHRDFYYNVTYNAIAYASREWAARRLAISHLSASGRFHENIATCNAEALAHYCDAYPNTIDSFIFLGCCMSVDHFAGIAKLNSEGQTSKNRSILVEVENQERHSLVHLSWDSKA